MNILKTQNNSKNPVKLLTYQSIKILKFKKRLFHKISQDLVTVIRKKMKNNLKV